MKSKSTPFLGISIPLFAAMLLGCGAQIHGGMDEGFPKGQLTTLQMSVPEGCVAVAVVYPEPINMSATEFGHSGNGDEETHWEESSKVHFLWNSPTSPLPIQWEYSTRSRKLTFLGAQFDVPDQTLAILGFDAKMKPTCTLMAYSPAAIAKLKTDLGETIRNALPTTPATPAQTK